MSKLSLKISAAVLLLATLLLSAVKVGRNAYAEGDGMMRAENIIEAVNADCSLDEKGENKVNSVKLQPKGNDFSGVWLTFDELKEKNAGDKVHIEARVRFESTDPLYGYSLADITDNKGNVIDGQFRLNKWQNLLFDTEVYLRNGVKCVFFGVKSGKNNSVYLSKATISDDVYDDKNMFGGVKMYMLEPEQYQTEGFMFVTGGGKIVMMDGGYGYDKTNVVRLIRQYKNEVDDWYISHYHVDHVEALIRILNEEDIYIKNLYYDFKVSQEILDKYGDEDNRLVEEMKQAVEDNRSKIGNVITPKKGDEFITDDIKVKVLNDAKFREAANMPNDSSVVYKFETPKKSILFLGDIADYGDILLQDKDFVKEIQTCQVVQLGHHGQHGASDKFYKTLTSMEVALYCAPQWLFDCDDGKGAGSRTDLLTLRTRELMRVLKVRRTYSLKYGRLVIE